MNGTRGQNPQAFRAPREHKQQKGANPPRKARTFRADLILSAGVSSYIRQLLRLPSRIDDRLQVERTTGRCILLICPYHRPADAKIAVEIANTIAQEYRRQTRKRDDATIISVQYQDCGQLYICR